MVLLACKFKILAHICDICVEGDYHSHHYTPNMSCLSSFQSRIRRVANNAALDQKDHVLGDVGGHVGDAFKAVRNCMLKMINMC